MNGLTLRISGGGCKMKNTIALEPVSIAQDIIKDLDRNELHNSFLNAISVDRQLAVLKKITLELKDKNNIKFLVKVFLQADAKHPVKSYITRFTAKNCNIQEQFSNMLSIEMASMIEKSQKNYKHYKETVAKLATCIENFAPGAVAVKNVEILLAGYLRDCLHCCIQTLSENALSPTEKNELFNLTHLTLRLLLYIIQKVSIKGTIIHLSDDIRCSVKEILFDEDAPMDTKSVCGMLLIAFHILENGIDSWTDLLTSQNIERSLKEMLSNDSAKLSLYSAIATVIPVSQLNTTIVDNEIAIIVLIIQILEIGERQCSDSTFTLGVTRSLVHISKSLDKSQDLGLRVTDCLLVFMWAHLEHYMDSVRHLTAQMLTNIIRYSAGMRRRGAETGVNNIIKALSTLDRHRKSFYLTLTSLANELGAHWLMEELPDIINEVICTLHVQAIQASATTFLEVLLQKHMKESPSDVTYDSWVRPILRHVSANSLDSAVMNILEDLLALAVKMDEGIMDHMLPYIAESCADVSRSDLKCVLLLLSVMRRSRRQIWSDVIGYNILEAAAVHLVDETRILSLSLVVESPKSTEMFTQKDLQFVLYFLKYNCNAQAPHFRQLMLSMIKKFIKRLEDSYKVLKRSKNEQCGCYLKFVENLRDQCYSSLLRGANYSRRFVALQILDWIEHVSLDDFIRVWELKYVDRLLVHLEDSYENIKILALSILDLCPVDMFQDKTYSISLNLEDILAEASSVKPTDCTCAAYKLLLLKHSGSRHTLSLNDNKNQPERVSYILLERLLAKLESELRTCEASVIHAAKDAPMYGLVHCMRYLVDAINTDTISSDNDWTNLISRIIVVCLSVNRAVACVVNNSSPEGHLPMDMNGANLAEQENSSNVYLQDGRLVTAQMVLLCAWRSVKEVSLLLGVLSSRLTIEGEVDEGAQASVSRHVVCEVGTHFTTLLAETKHRGAFEQAYVGFTKLLTRLWRCRSPELHELPKCWLERLLQVIQSGDSDTLCATRRSAGLPYMIQALVITELQVTGNAKCFSSCMRALLRVAACSPSLEARTHCVNVLRALYRNTYLDDVVAPYVGEGLLLALNGFERTTWQERNSSTLLFSALMVRIFGVTRGKDMDALCTRNRMTGRIFFLRYPALADFMLNKLEEASGSDMLLTSAYPVLLLLARLYPSALEGTVSNLKLISFIPAVQACAGSAALKTRQLAAKAMVPLISPHMYIPHVIEMLRLIGDRCIKRNYCHGIILQLIKLLEAKPDNLPIDEKYLEDLAEVLLRTKWIVEQTLSHIPCYLLTDDSVKMIDLIIFRFPAAVYSKFINEIKPILDEILFEKSTSILNSGKDICLRNIVKFYLSILNTSINIQETCIFIQRCLKHHVYEIVLVMINHILAIFEESPSEYRKLPIISNCMDQLRKENYILLLCNILDNKYLECKQKALQLLTLEKNTQHLIIRAKLGKDILTDSDIVDSLIYLLEIEHENLTHIYLSSLANYLSECLIRNSVSGTYVLEAIRVIFCCSFSNNGTDTRATVVRFLEENFERLITLDLHLDPNKLFEYKATIWSTMLILLEDDEQTFRQRISSIIITTYNKYILRGNEISFAIPSKALEILVQFVCSYEYGKEILCVLALLDFKSEVCMNDEINDECRVFDTNERYNIFSEESIVTAACAQALHLSATGIHDVNKIVDDPKYRQTFEALCDQNLIYYKLSRESCKNVVNPKISLFIELIS